MNDFFSKKYIFKNQTLVVVCLCLGQFDFLEPWLPLCRAELQVVLREVLPARALQSDHLSEKRCPCSQSIEPHCATRHPPHLGFRSRTGPGDAHQVE